MTLAASRPAVSQTVKLTPGTGDWEEPSTDLAGKNVTLRKGNALYLLQTKKGFLTPIACNIDDAQVAPGGKFVVYSSDSDPLATNDDGNRELFLIDLGKRATTQLTNATEDCNQPSIDKRGKRIAFLSKADFTGANADGSEELFVLERATSAFTQVTDTALGSPSDDVQMSANGNVVVFTSTADLTGENADNNREIFLFDIAAGTLAQLTQTTSGQNRRPSVDQGGKLVAFESTVDGLSGPNLDGNFEVYRLTTADLSVVRLTDTDADSRNAVISANGKVVVYESDGDPLGGNADGSDELFLVVVNRDGSLSREQLTAGAGGTQSAHARPTSTGKRVFFDSDADLTGAGAGNRHVFVIAR